MTNYSARRSLAVLGIALSAIGCSSSKVQVNQPIQPPAKTTVVVSAPQPKSTPAQVQVKTQPSLSSNVVGNYSLGRIDSSAEDPFSIPQINFYGKTAFVLPLTGPKGEELANSTIPSFYLIPSEKARITETQVGVPGGNVEIDSFDGSNFFPYGVEFDTSTNCSKLKLRDLKKDNGLARLVVPSMTVPEINQNKTTSINLEQVTNRDLPFVTQTFGTGQSYIVVPISENQQYASGVSKDNIWPFFYIRVGEKGFDVERTGVSQGNPSVWGEVVVFYKTDKNKYITERGPKTAPAPATVPGAIGAPNQNKP